MHSPTPTTRTRTQTWSFSSPRCCRWVPAHVCCHNPPHPPPTCGPAVFPPSIGVSALCTAVAAPPLPPCDRVPMPCVLMFPLFPFFSCIRKFAPYRTYDQCAFRRFASLEVLCACSLPVCVNPFSFRISDVPNINESRC